MIFAQPAHVEIRYRPSYEEIADAAISAEYRRIETDMLSSRRGSKFIEQTISTAELSNKLLKLSRLHSNWDTYGSEAPSPVAVSAALEVGSELIKLGLTPDAIVPSSEGGVAIVFLRANKKYADIEFFNSGNIIAVRHSPQDDPQTWCITRDNDSIQASFNLISQYFSI